ncbi:MAG TPA: hypothetical protein VID04_19260 [Methylomirabilota bacterium]
MKDRTLREEMRRGFSAVTRRLTALDTRVGALDTRVGALDARVGTLDEHVRTLDEHVGALDERVRHGGVLLEALRNDVRQLAETQLLADERFERDRQENEAAHREILALLRTSYRDLDRRGGRLEAPGGEGTARS